MISKYLLLAIHLLLSSAILGHVVQAQADGDVLSFSRNTNKERDPSPRVIPEGFANVANEARGSDIVVKFGTRDNGDAKGFPEKRSPKGKGSTGSTGSSNSTSNNDDDDSAAAIVGISAIAPFAIASCLLATMGWLGI